MSQYDYALSQLRNQGYVVRYLQPAIVARMVSIAYGRDLIALPRIVKG